MTSHEEAITHLLSEIESSEKRYRALSDGEEKKMLNEKIGNLHIKLNYLANGTVYEDNFDNGYF